MSVSLFQAVFQPFQLLGQLGGQLVAKLVVKRPDALGLGLPEIVVHVEQAGQRVFVHTGTFQVDVLGAGQVADGGCWLQIREVLMNLKKVTLVNI